VVPGMFLLVIGEEQDGNCNELKQKVSFEDSIFDVSCPLVALRLPKGS